MFTKYFKKLSIFGRELQFENEYSNKYNSYFSLLLTLILIFGTITVGFIVGTEVYKRKKPKLTESSRNIEIDDSSFYLDEFPLMMSFVYSDGTPIKKEDLNKYLNIFVTNVNVTTGGYVTQQYNLIDCNFDSSPNKDIANLLQKTKKDLSNFSLFCFPKDILIKNKFGSSNSNTITIGIVRCFSNCASDLNNRIEGIQTGLIHANSLIDPSDYEQAVKYFEHSSIYILSTRLAKRVIYSFKKNILDTDKGWLFENIETRRYISLGSITADFFLSDNELMRIIIESSIIVTKSLRVYMKIQELFAILGGFFNACYIIINVIFSDYLKFEYYLYINRTTKFMDEKKSELKKEKFSSSHVNIKQNNIDEVDIDKLKEESSKIKFNSLDLKSKLHFNNSSVNLNIIQNDVVNINVPKHKVLDNLVKMKEINLD